MERDHKNSTLGSVMGVIGWILLILCCLGCVLALASSEPSIAAVMAGAAMTGLILIAGGNIVQNIHSIRHFTQAGYLQLLEANQRGTGGSRIEVSAPDKDATEAPVTAGLVAITDKPERYSRRFPNKD